MKQNPALYRPSTTEMLRALVICTILIVFPLQIIFSLVDIHKPPFEVPLVMLLAGLAVQPLAAIGIFRDHNWPYAVLLFAAFLCYDGLVGAIGPAIFCSLKVVDIVKSLLASSFAKKA